MQKLMVATAIKRPSQGLLYSRAFTRLRLEKKKKKLQFYTYPFGVGFMSILRYGAAEA